MKKFYYTFFLVLIIAIACDEKPPIDEENFVIIYSNLISVPDSISVDSLKFSEYKQKVISGFGFTQKQYEETIEFYNREPQKWEEFFRKVIKHIETTNDSVNTSL